MVGGCTGAATEGALGGVESAVLFSLVGAFGGCGGGVLFMFCLACAYEYLLRPLDNFSEKQLKKNEKKVKELQENQPVLSYP